MITLKKQAKFLLRKRKNIKGFEKEKLSNVECREKILRKTKNPIQNRVLINCKTQIICKGKKKIWERAQNQFPKQQSNASYHFANIFVIINVEINFIQKTQNCPLILNINKIPRRL